MSMNSSEMGDMTNSEKILYSLRTVNETVSTSELAELTGINIKNITRYLKDLEREKLIERTTIQEGKKRFVYVGLNTSRKGESDTSRNNDKMVMSTKNKRDSKTIGQKDSVRNTSRKGESDTSRNLYNLSKKQKTDLKYIETMAEELRKFGSVMSLDEMQKIAIFIRENKTDLITAVDTYLRTYDNPSHKTKRKGITARRNERMKEILTFLEGLK